MTSIGAAGAAVPAAPTDPRELALHLEICRLQAELEGLEARIHQVEAARAAGGSGYDPFVERAEELVERMVASLYVTGRAEIAESAAASDAEAEAVIAEARARAQAILNEARGELASVLVDRADAVDAEVASGAVLDLTEQVLLIEPEAPEAVEPVDALMVVGTDEGAPEPVADLDDTDAPSLPLPVTAAAAVPPVAEPLVEPAPVAEPEPVPLEAPSAAAPAAIVVPDEDEVPAGQAPALEATAPHLPPPAPSAGAEASARTDAAFEAWLAVAPSADAVPTADAGPETDPELVPEGVRPSWVRPVEAAIALLTVAVVVVLALLLVG